MLNKRTSKSVAAALGTTFAVVLAASPIANAADNPFSLTEISNGYMVVDQPEGKCGEGKATEKKAAEGKCGGEKSHEEKDSGKTSGEGKCGEGKCGGQA